MNDKEGSESGNETCSYSEEEISMDMEIEVDDEDQERETNLAVETILEETEQLEEQETKPKSNGKQRAPRSPSKSDMWKVLSKLTNEIMAIKETKKRPRSEKRVESGKKPKIDVKNDRAFDRPSSSRQNEAMEVEQLSTVVNEKQLSSANDKQLKPATKIQLRSEKKQVAKATTTRTAPQERENTVTLQDSASEEDPLRAEQEEIQMHVNANQEAVAQDEDELSDENELSEEDADEDNVEGIFEELVGAVDILGDEENPGLPLTQVWADKINLAWKTKINRTATNALIQKYKTPSNLDALKVPKMNKEIWKLCNKWQRKADLNLSACQRYLIKVVTAILKLHDLFSTLPRSTRQVAMQTTADSVSLLGKVNRELASKRKISARPALMGDYKSLATNTEVSTDQLFGDNLTQDIKDVQTRRKIGDPYAYGNRSNTYGNRYGRYGRGNYGNYTQSSNNNNPFLWRGRGRSRPPNYRNSQNQRNQSGQYHQKKN